MLRALRVLHGEESPSCGVDKSSDRSEARLPADKASALQNQGFRQNRFAVRPIVDPVDNEASVGYDSVGNVASQQDSEGHVTHSEFDANGSQSAVTDDAGTTYYDWTPERMLSQTGHCP